ncbi:MAG: serine/threonine protein kinase [Planctomycetaceae bacterium]|jgi:serine/threonine protein kinase|nr:serine/threonine protein kinase [Planctomycetaceae bacterium]
MSDKLQISRKSSHFKPEVLSVERAGVEPEVGSVSESEFSTDRTPDIHNPTPSLRDLNPNPQAPNPNPQDLTPNPQDPNPTPRILPTTNITTGTLLGHFIVKNYIGGGGMGRVYLATDTLLDRNVAVKVLPQQRANDQSTVARFMNEAKSAARLNHEHIAQVYFAGEQDGIPFIVFEYVEGTNVRKLINESGVLSLPQALNFMLQIVHALAHAAENGVVHRDVKPSNILITREGKAKLIDMGLARLLNPAEGAGDLTASGVTLGTFDYISPEQARDPRNADIRSDIYSLGCTFFFMLAGRPPFPEGTVLQKLLQHQGDLPPDIRDIQPNIPADISVLIQRMMAKDPKQRFQTPDNLITALTENARKIGMQPVGHSNLYWKLEPPVKPPILLRYAIWLSSFFVLFLIVFLLDFFGKGSGQFELPKMPEPFSVELAVSGNSADATNRDIPPNPAPNENLIRQLTVIDLLAVDRIVQARYPLLETVLSATQNNANDLLAKVHDKTSTGFGIAPEMINTVLLPDWYVSANIGADNIVSGGKAVEGGGKVAGGDQDKSTGAKFVGRSLMRVDPSFDVRVEANVPLEAGSTNSDKIRTFTNLKSAVEAAGANSIIELRWNDYLRSEPFVISDQNIIFTAAEGFRPVILFETAKKPDATPDMYAVKSMITVNSCELEFVDVSIELRISKDVLSARWTLFDLVGKNGIDFSRAVITVANAAENFSPYHQDVVFFRSGRLYRELEGSPFLTDWGIGNRFFSESTPDMLILDSKRFDRFVSGKGFGNNIAETIIAGMPSNKVVIKLSNSMLRGEAAVVQTEVATDINFAAEKVIIATAKPFAQIEENYRGIMPKPVKISFDSVTFAGRQPFVRLTTGKDSEPNKVECKMRSSLFIMYNMPLFEFEGSGGSDKADLLFKWDGDRNDYQNVPFAWKAKPLAATGEGNVDYVEFLLADWVKLFDVEAGVNRLYLPEFRKPMCQLVPNDFVPKDAGQKSGRKAAGWNIDE